MIDFPYKLIKPKDCIIAGIVWVEEGESYLNFYIGIDSEEFELSEEITHYDGTQIYSDKADPYIIIENIIFDNGIKSFHDLQNKKFEFGQKLNLEEPGIIIAPFALGKEYGEIQGSVYLLSCHNPVLVDYIECGEIQGNIIPCNIKLMINFQNEGVAADTPYFILNCDLRIKDISMHYKLAKVYPQQQLENYASLCLDSLKFTKFENEKGLLVYQPIL